MQRLVAELRERLATARLGGPERARERHTKAGKLLARERVERLLDPGTAFLELSPLAAFGMYDDEAPGAGVITGIGRVSGNECVIVVKAATGVDVSAEDLGGADVHTRVSGVADHLALDDPHAIAIARDIVAQMERPTYWGVDDKALPEPPAHDPTDLYALIPQDIRTQYDVHEVIARLVDGSRFHEFKALYGTTVVCGFARSGGVRVGSVAKEGIH